MGEPLLFALLFLLIGLGLGFVLGLWWMQLRLGQRLIPQDQIATTYVSREVYDALREQADVITANLQEKIESEKNLAKHLASEQTRRQFTEQQVQEQQALRQRQLEENRVAFEHLANRLLEEKSHKFTQQNQHQLRDLLEPLREKIKTFEDNIERRYLEETRDRVSLKKEIEHLRELNHQLSQDAGNLTAALKGDNKTQGDWGEVQLELLLQKAGLQKGLHFQTQSSFRDREGKTKRPDFIINLPDDKHLVIDCKVSLTAYERYSAATDSAAQERALKAHLDSIRAHIKGLSKKEYQQLYQINSPDYLLLFIPIEPAFALAVQADQQLFVDALEQNIVLVTNSTLLATMRTVAYIWRQDKQQKSVQEIARQSGQLYDKFVNFVDDLRQVGQRLDQLQNAYGDAMYKLSDGKRFSQTLIGRAEKLRKLGARTSKKLPADLRREEE
jgi:DNA recombination protein RmuC